MSLEGAAVGPGHAQIMLAAWTALVSWSSMKGSTSRVALDLILLLCSECVVQSLIALLIVLRLYPLFKNKSLTCVMLRCHALSFLDSFRARRIWA